MLDGGPDLLDDDTRAFLLGPVSALLGTADARGVPDVARIGGFAPVDRTTMRLIVGADATEARANAAEAGAAVSVLITDITTYRSWQWKGSVVAWHQRTPGDLALLHDHVERFAAAAPSIGLDAAGIRRIFPTEVVALVVSFDALFDQTPGPSAGRRIGATP